MQQETTVDTKSPNASRLVQSSKLHKKAVTPVTTVRNDGDKSSVKCINRKPLVTPSKRQRTPCTRESSRFTGKTVSRPPKIVKKNNSPINKKYSMNYRLAVASSPCRKSLSMIELSPDVDHSDINIRSETLSLMGQGIPKISCLTSESSNTLWSDPTIEAKDRDQQPEDRSIKSARLVCHVLTLNAWRRRREEVIELQNTIEQLGQQIDHLQLQIVVLKRLVDTQNSRVGKLGAEVHRAKTQLDGVISEKDFILEEKNKLENELELVKQSSEERRVAGENFKNDFCTIKNQLQAIDFQMEKERDKISKLREDKKVLLEKVSITEALANQSHEQAEIAEKTVEDLQDKLGIHQGIIESLEEDKIQLDRNIKHIETDNMDLKNSLLTTKETEKSLNKKIMNLEMELKEREVTLHHIESIYQSQLLELNEMKERLIKQSEENGWSNKVLQFAGSIVRVPGVILRTLSFFATGGVPSHP